MKHQIENNFLRLTVESLGAEMQSLIVKESNTELIWQAGRAWPKHSPVLFPIVGQLKDNRYHYNGKEYTMSRHGFARESEFQLIGSTDATLVFQLKSNEHSRIMYPFDFLFEVTYTLTDDQLEIAMLVKNTSDDTMYASYGAHPAFKVPLQNTEEFEDYEIRFDNVSDFKRWPLLHGLISDEPVAVLTQNNILPVTHELFAEDALVFKNQSFSSVSIGNKHSGKGIKMIAEEWPYFGIWSARGGDFICLEPWQGIADTVASDGILQNKEGMLSIKPGEQHRSVYSVLAVL